MIFKGIKYQLLLLLLGLNTVLLAQQQIDYNNLTMQQAMQVAVQNNKKLKIQALKQNVAVLKEKDLKNEKLPDVNFHTSFNVLDNIHQFENGVSKPSTSYTVPRIQYDFTLSAEVPIYLGGKLKNEEKKAEVETEIEHLKMRRDEKVVKMEIITAYMQALHLKEQQKLIEDKMREDTLVIDQTEKLRKNGLVTNNDVLRTQLQLSNHKMAHSELENEFSIIEHHVKTILALPVSQSLHINIDDLLLDSPTAFHLEELVEEALHHNEQFLIVEREIEVKEFDKKIVYSNYLPKITAGANYGYKYPNFMFFPPVSYLYRFGLIGVNVNMPLSNLHKNKVKMKMIDAHISMAKLEVEEKEEQIRDDVYAAKARLEEATKKLIIAQEAIVQAAENYRIVRLKYSNKLSLITELIDADNAYLEAQSNLISLTINKQLKYYQLQYVLGNI